jgi:hypothetical protein
MASTRNKNSTGNYNLEQRNHTLASDYKLYAKLSHSDTRLPGNGLNPGQIHGNKLSQNTADIESFLFGINSTNLVNPAVAVTPNLFRLESAHIFDKQGILLPIPLHVEKGQRPTMT